MYVVVVLVFSFDFTVLYSIHSIDLIICIGFGSNNMMYIVHHVQSSFFQPKVLTFNQLNRPTS